MFLYRWAMKACGYHVCDEFTQWERKVYQGERYCSSLRIATYTFVESYQERRCTLCGRLQQERIGPAGETAALHRTGDQP